MNVTVNLSSDEEDWKEAVYGVVGDVLGGSAFDKPSDAVVQQAEEALRKWLREGVTEFLSCEAKVREAKAAIREALEELVGEQQADGPSEPALEEEDRENCADCIPDPVERQANAEFLAAGCTKEELREWVREGAAEEVRKQGRRTCADCIHRRTRTTTTSDEEEWSYDYCKLHDFDEADLDAYNADWEKIASDCEEFDSGIEAERRILRIARREAKRTWQESWAKDIRLLATELAQQHIIEAVARLEQKHGKVREVALETLRAEVRRVIEEGGGPWQTGDVVPNLVTFFQRIGWPKREPKPRCGDDDIPLEVVNKAVLKPSEGQ